MFHIGRGLRSHPRHIATCLFSTNHSLTSQKKFNSMAGANGLLQNLSSTNTTTHAVNTITSLLSSQDVPEARLSAEYLVVKAMDLTDRWHLQMLQAENAELSKEQVSQLVCMVSRRLNREPIQHIVGDWDFAGITLALRSGILCPRPETEELVILCVNELQSFSAPRILDIGAGSGAIGLALLAQLPHATCEAIDIEADCVALANENAHAVGVNDRYSCIQTCIGDLHQFCSRPSYDLVVSNPPYIPEGFLSSLEPEVIHYERHSALFGGKDGLDIIRKIIAEVPRLLLPDGAVMMEVDRSHPRMISLELHKKQCSFNPSLKMEKVDRDIYGEERFITLKWNP